MNRRRLEQGYLVLLGVVVLVAIFGFIWPNYRRAAVAASQIESLEGKIGSLEDARELLQEQSDAVQRLESIQQSRCRRIPASAKVAELVRALSLEVDGVRVADQTFTVSGRRDNVDGDNRFEGLSMVVELDASFERICSVIDRCEALDHLVRVTGLDIAVKRQDADTGRLQASVSIDAIHQAGEGDTP